MTKALALALAQEVVLMRKDPMSAVNCPISQITSNSTKTKKKELIYRVRTMIKMETTYLVKVASISYLDLKMSRTKRLKNLSRKCQQIKMSELF